MEPLITIQLQYCITHSYNTQILTFDLQKHRERNVNPFFDEIYKDWKR